MMANVGRAVLEQFLVETLNTERFGWKNVYGGTLFERFRLWIAGTRMRLVES